MSAWAAVGWAANACFFARFVVQWITSERQGRSTAPRSFWWLSLAGSLGLVAYTGWRGEPVLLVGALVNAAIYLRNLALRRRPEALGALPVAALGLLAAVALLLSGVVSVRPDIGRSMPWLAVGFAGQATWSARFVVQWWASERDGRSHFPPAFWWTSLAGNAVLLAYAVHLRDAVWIVGLSLGPLVQVRNLMLGARPGRDGRRLAAGATA